MTTRDILDYQGTVIGQLTLPDDVAEARWTAALAPYAISPAQRMQNSIDLTIEVRIAFCSDMMGRFKKMNILAGINGAQGLWMHHRLRAMDINLAGLPLTLDILNMVVSGDVELGCIALQYCTPDDMTMPFHWLSADRLAWLVAELKTFLGWP